MDDAAPAGQDTWDGGADGAEAAVTVAAGDLSATFLPDLGLLGVSLRHRGDELIALPGGLAGWKRRSLTGLPLMAPWANRLAQHAYEADGVRVGIDPAVTQADANGLPIHGTMIARPGWTTRTQAAGVDGRAVLEAGFDYGRHPELLAAFPFPHELTVTVVVAGSSMELATTLRATGDRPVPVTFGWHPYLRLPGAERAEWRLELPDREHLLLDRRSLPTGQVVAEPAEGDVIGARTFDDLYRLPGRLPGDRRMALAGGGRRVVVELDAGYPYGQVWVPPGRDFACLEAMTAPIDGLSRGQYRIVEPGDAFTAAFTIRVESPSP